MKEIMEELNLAGFPCEELTAPIKAIEDKGKLVGAFLKSKGLMKQHIESFDHFINDGIKKIVLENQKIVSDMDPSYYIKYLSVSVGNPTIEGGYQMNNLTTPHECRLRDVTYSAPITVDVEFICNQQRAIKKNVVIGKMPIMLRSTKCRLFGKTEYELIALKECHLDPGGYFIVNGTERVILMQEKLSENLMIVEKDSEGLITCHVTSSTPEKQTRTEIVAKESKFYLKHNCFTSDIPAFIIFKALGCTSDQEIVQLIGTDERTCRRLFLTIMECSHAKIYTQDQALRYIGKKIRQRKMCGKAGKEKNPSTEAAEILYTTIFAHVPVEELNFKMKAIYMAIMIRRIIGAEENSDLLDDTDYYGYKRLELAGSLLALLFEDLFKRFNIEIKLKMDRSIYKAKAYPEDPTKYMCQDSITNGLVNAIATGNWTVKHFKLKRVGVTQVLSRLSYISTLRMMTRVESQFKKSRKVSGSRCLHGSQWGMLCFCDTPEGERCGLAKHLALMSHVTTDLNEDPVIELAFNFGVEDIRLCQGFEFDDNQTYLVFVNGNLIGVKKNYRQLVDDFRKLRRAGVIHQFISIAPHHTKRCVYIATDGGRLCRPYIIVEKCMTKVTDEHMTELKNNLRTFGDFLKDGLVEFLDVNEENDSLIALYEKDIKKETTHLEIEPYTILGIAAGLIPYLNHNKFRGNTYQSAIGTIGWNQKNRMDPLMYNLVYPQRPMVKTHTFDFIHCEDLPVGQNATVAVMSYSGFDIKDAIVLNKASLDRGFGRCLAYKTCKCEIKTDYALQSKDRISGPKVDPITKVPVWEHLALDSDGIACPGARIEKGQLLVNKEITVTSKNSNDAEKKEYKEVPVRAKSILPSYVEKVLLSSNESCPIIKILLRQTRQPEVGDKFTCRHGEKGVVGLIAEPIDMPFSEDGMIPDLILNPHRFQGNMTVGKLMEILSRKIGALNGKIDYGTAFGDNEKVLEAADVMIKCGFNYQGKDCMTSGETGEPIEAYIFHGIVYYQMLKYMVIDKIQARSRGALDILTRQPIKNNVWDGGVKIGEREKNCLIEHGASMVLLESFMLSSDPFQLDVCRKCGLFCNIGWCNFCRSSREIASIRLPYATKLMFQELLSMNIVPRLKLSKYFE